ncbi:alpha/beta hydrolase [Agromyces sp. H3Y2-19a]|uniref:alpha/beta fold hydrolase n=1 Tax=Agromyces chromiiresistens TaxID=3030835 RepID=UPI0023B92653|nr:alpha/beta hydrolase [Agromyces chromiiresistens]MDF0515158.1 alpha/beta hydrolase [Agromyces chromiiresistens]
MASTEAASNRHRERKTPKRPQSKLAEHWTNVDGLDVFYRESPAPPPGAPVVMHVHGFGLSGHYLLPTAELLADDFHTLVPDLPGFGRSARRSRSEGLTLGSLAEAAARFLDDRGIEKATLVGNSMGCPVICEFGHHFPDRLERAILVSPAGGYHNQPLARAMVQLARDGGREPKRMVRVAAPDYLKFGVASTVKMFGALTRYPTLERLLSLPVPILAVIGDRDPLMPDPARVHEVVAHVDTDVIVVVMEGAAHAINFSHPGELAHIIRQFMADEPITDDPDSPGETKVIELHRGARRDDSDD